LTTPTEEAVPALPVRPSKASLDEPTEEAVPALPVRPSKASLDDADRRGRAGFAGAAV
jgi:hypothetical protein